MEQTLVFNVFILDEFYCVGTLPLAAGNGFLRNWTHKEIISDGWGPGVFCPVCGRGIDEDSLVEI